MEQTDLINCHKALLQQGFHAAFYNCNHNDLSSLFQVQSLFLSFFNMKWEGHSMSNEPKNWKSQPTIPDFPQI